MGKRNGFIEIDQDKNSLNQILKFIDHHNNWFNYFEEDERRKLWDLGEIPREDLFLKIIEDVNKEKFWANILCFRGMCNFQMWADKYFPHLKIYNNLFDSPCYQGGNKSKAESWKSWPTYTIEEFQSKQELKN